MINKRIRILYYSGHCEIVGGDAKYLFDLVNGMDKESFSMSICTDFNPVFVDRARQWLQVECPIEYLNTFPPLFQEQRRGRILSYLLRELTLQYLRDEWKNWKLFFAMLKSNRDKIDVFHFNNGGYPGKVAGLVAMLAAKAAGIHTVIMTIHNEPSRRSWRFPGHILFDYLISHYCHMTIAASEVLRQKLIDYRGYLPEKVRTIYCGLIDLPKLCEEDIAAKRIELSIDRCFPVLLISGNIEEERKGHVQLFQALKMLKCEYPNVQLLVVGNGSAARTAYLFEQASAMGIADSVRFLGYRTDIHELNCVVDVAVVPSLYGEATPYTIKEAARAGKPVVTTSAGGCADAVEDGISGFVVPPYDIEALARALSTLLADEELRCRMGIAGRKIFLQRFLLSEVVQGHEKLYHELVNRQRAPQ